MCLQNNSWHENGVEVLPKLLLACNPNQSCGEVATTQWKLRCFCCHLYKKRGDCSHARVQI